MYRNKYKNDSHFSFNMLWTDKSRFSKIVKCLIGITAFLKATESPLRRIKFTSNKIWIEYIIVIIISTLIGNRYIYFLKMNFRITLIWYLGYQWSIFNVNFGSFKTFSKYLNRTKYPCCIARSLNLLFSDFFLWERLYKTVRSEKGTFVFFNRLSIK